jgi:hypothetical protein
VYAAVGLLSSAIRTCSKNTTSTFRIKAPAAFWAGLVFSLVWHALAVLVFIILRFMGASIAPVGAFALEGLTKVITKMAICLLEKCSA